MTTRRWIALWLTAFAFILCVTIVAWVGPAVAPSWSTFLLTSSGPSTCYLNFAEGDLVADPAAGTAIIENGHRAAVMWPANWTAQQSIFGIAVIDPRGKAVARTGERVRIGGAYTDRSQDTWLACWVIRPGDPQQDDLLL